MDFHSRAPRVGGSDFGACENFAYRYAKSFLFGGGGSWKCTRSVAFAVHICIMYVSTTRYVIKGPMAVSILFACFTSHWSSRTISKALPGTFKKKHTKNAHKEGEKTFPGCTLDISHAEQVCSSNHRKQALRFFVFFAPVMSPGG